MEGEFDKISSIGMFEHVGIAQPPGLLPDGAPAAAAARPIPASHHLAPRQEDRARPSARCGPNTGRSSATSSPAASSTISACRSPISSVTASKSTTSRAGASIISARPGCGGSARRAAPKPRRRSARKTRMWLLYLAGCSLAFERGASGQPDAGLEAHKGSSGLPPTRADLYR